MQGQRPQAAPVSIHAPTQGATCFQLRNLRFNSCFNPRAHAGRDTKKPLPAARTGKFQSTRPRRARQWQMNAPNTVNKVSIHAPTQGATFFIDLYQGKIVFQSTRPRRARHDFHFRYSPGNRVSIHAPTQGATRGNITVPFPVILFQSTRPRRARPA